MCVRDYCLNYLLDDISDKEGVTVNEKVRIKRNNENSEGIKMQLEDRRIDKK